MNPVTVEIDMNHGYHDFHVSITAGEQGMTTVVLMSDTDLRRLALDIDAALYERDQHVKRCPAAGLTRIGAESIDQYAETPAQPNLIDLLDQHALDLAEKLIEKLHETGEKSE